MGLGHDSIRLAENSRKTKILVIRFSAIGDIVLTTPVLSLLKKYYPNAEIHFLVKEKFAHVLNYLPHIDNVVVLKDFTKTFCELMRQRYDFVIDLQNSMRSSIIRYLLPVNSTAVNKQNLYKLLMTMCKQKLNVLHIVERYAKTLRCLKIAETPGKLLFKPEATPDIQHELHRLRSYSKPVIATVLGATHNTKRWPYESWITALNKINWPVILLGGIAEQRALAAWVELLRVPYFNACGILNLAQSAACIDGSDCVISHDTGLMHIAAALQKPIISIWGNTVPEFGMFPWKTYWKPAQVENLPCRPCSKIGYSSCPQQHFRCMKQNHPEKIVELVLAIPKIHFLNANS